MSANEIAGTLNAPLHVCILSVILFEMDTLKFREIPSRIKPRTLHANPLYTISHACDATLAAIPYPYKPVADVVFELGACSAYATVVCYEIQW